MNRQIEEQIHRGKNIHSQEEVIMISVITIITNVVGGGIVVVGGGIVVIIGGCCYSWWVLLLLVGVVIVGGCCIDACTIQFTNIRTAYKYDEKYLTKVTTYLHRMDVSSTLAPNMRKIV